MRTGTLPFTMDMKRKPVLSLPANMLKKILQKRIFPGFRIGEGLAWLVFHISWAILLGGLYYFTGQFELPDFFSQWEFIYTQAYVLIVKAVFLLPFWWLFFMRLRKVRLLPKILLHLLTGPLFSLLSVGLIYTIKAKILNGQYPFRAVVGDIYATWIFYFTHFAVFHAYNFWLDAKRKFIEKQELVQLAHQSEMKALKAQIEPHFLFNTLNSISASVPQELEKTRVLIAKLADTFRYSLEITNRDKVSLHEEIDFIKTWLWLEQNRFKNRLQVVYRIDEKLLSTPVPPMILQPLVENALNHGISPKIEGGTVTIECSQEDKFVLISVTDTGVGYQGDFTRMFSEGIGLSNTNQRLKILFDEPLCVERKTEGLRFYFKIPLHRPNEKKSNYNR